MIERDFLSIDQKVHACLSRQDSDNALFELTRWALENRSSDLHFDIGETSTLVRLRIDGDLVLFITLSKQEYKLILERLKYKSDLKLNITNIPQDGKFRIQTEQLNLDVRVSTLPVKNGENVVARILDSSNQIPKLEELGFQWTAKRQIDRCLKKNSGMILVTWPTGSGKTTTLYSILQNLNSSENKVITLEDPVEYDLPGIVQSEVNEKNGYTYASGLRALLRQDPDVIMIGEIRDLDTATIATQASLTGHLVLSTLHTKSASETLERLMNIGLPRYILASAIDIIVAQRLIRRLCPHCSIPAKATDGQNEIIRYIMKDIGMGAVMKSKKAGFILREAHGCDRCNNSGYRGRLGIFEVLHFSDDMREKIRDGASPEEILALGRQQDLILMREDGIFKAMLGKTTFEEVFKSVE